MSGKEFKKIREKFKLSREDFASIFGFSGYMSIANIENGSRNPGPVLTVLMRTLNALPEKKAHEIIELLRAYGKK